MKNPFDFFDEIYCINLDHRTDRWKAWCKMNLIDLELQIE